MTVLHVEDDPALATLVRKALSRRGHTVVHVTTGDAALARIEAGDVDVIALDHTLAGETGLDILARVGPRDRRPPIVYVTGSADAHLAVEALKSGADDYVIKDVSGEFYDLLVAALEQAIERWRLKKARAENERLVREARDRAELLLREVNHRVANSLGLVAAMVRMQASLVVDDEAKRALQETQSRITAVAGVHRHLYSSASVGEVEISDYLGHLLAELQASLAGTGAVHRVASTLAPLVLKTDHAVSLGIAVGELVTNAFKYAYPETESGEIRVAVSAASGVVTVSVEDDGVGWHGEGPTKGSGLGSKIVGAMCRTLDATLEWSERPVGTAAVIRFPIAATAH
ncbi:MAG: response regulator [Phyllobacteriaceae bacterium]|nr:response regulator [Phyllobacteriaceae bacterium]